MIYIIYDTESRISGGSTFLASIFRSIEDYEYCVKENSYPFSVYKSTGVSRKLMIRFVGNKNVEIAENNLNDDKSEVSFTYNEIRVFFKKEDVKPCRVLDANYSKDILIFDRIKESGQ